MHRTDGRLFFSPSDLNDALDCAHLVDLERRCALGELARPDPGDAASLLSRKGGEHEADYLRRYRARYGDALVAFTPEPLTSLALIEAAAQATIAAMERGAQVIYQGAFFDGEFFGRADFLRRVERPCARWAWSYEAVEAKLALSVKPYYLVQLAHYSGHLERIMGTAPHEMHVVLGSGVERSFRVDECSAYERRLRAQFLAAIAEPAPTYPLEVSRCDLCAWQARCSAQRLHDDHLSLVARIRSDQIERLERRGITTVASLAAAGDDRRPPGMDPGTFATLRAQAAIQVRGRTQGRHVYELLDVADPASGLARLPRPDDGDLFFDMEGDPLYASDRGLEYLFGFYSPFDDRYTAFWARSRDDERAAFEAAADFIAERRRRFPLMHVYHYAPYETVAMRRLMGIYGTRERTIDDLLRNEVFVDLYAVVRQALRISQPSYSIKKLEPFYGMERETDVRRGDDSIVMFERWLAGGDDAILHDIERYNEDDCRSTHRLLRWLLELRDERMPWREIEIKDVPEDDGRSELALRLLDTVPAPASLDALRAFDEPARARWLLGNLLDYHARENKPAYWEYYDRLRNVDRLLEFDHEAIGALALRSDVAPFKLKSGERNFVYTYTFPEQLHNLGTDEPHSPDHEIAAGRIVKIDHDARELQIKLSAKIRPNELRALIPGTPLPNRDQRNALAAIAQAYLDGTLERDFPATADLLLARRPRTRTLRDVIQPQRVSAAAVARIVDDLDGGYLAVQGPPGSGKSTLAAEIIVDRLRAGRRVGIAARGHKAIHNLLAKIEDVAASDGLRFRGFQKYSSVSEDSQYHSRHDRSWIVATSSNDDLAQPHDLAAGTPWLFSRPDLAGRYDDLFVDEAGQLSLADALACSRAARNVILLGDPLQLKAVSQGSHPLGTDASILAHAIGPHDTIEPRQGIFLDRSYRMAPAICTFISESVYEGRLQSAPQAQQHDLRANGFAGSGLYFVPVEHEGNARSSEEEALAIAELARTLLAGTVTTARDGERRCDARDIIVVAPYNAQRTLIRRRLEAAGMAEIAVGTVDKFQGQEAAVVIYSMATSNAATLPRDLEFLFERNRLNVAISRAQCASILVCSPQLLTVRCSTPEELALVNLLCRFVERATPVAVTAAVGTSSIP